MRDTTANDNSDGYKSYIARRKRRVRRLDDHAVDVLVGARVVGGHVARGNRLWRLDLETGGRPADRRRRRIRRDVELKVCVRRAGTAARDERHSRAQPQSARRLLLVGFVCDARAGDAKHSGQVVVCELEDLQGSLEKLDQIIDAIGYIPEIPVSGY